MVEAVIDEFDRLDEALFGTWDHRPTYQADLPMEDRALARQVSAALEVKSAEALVSAGEDLRLLLNEMTVEMRAQFSTFRQMRESAAEALSDGDEAAQKLARADVKAATDAMSLIVGTLEKVDSLQRQLARDRDIEAERAADKGGYAEAKARFVRLIEERAHETAYKLFAAWKTTGPPDAVARRLEGDLAKPAHQAAGAGEDGKESGQGLHGAGPGDECDFSCT